jgi:predicted nucleotidyltransferase
MNAQILINQVNALMMIHFEDFKGTYFFGSRSRNKSSSDSDYDLLLSFGHRLTWEEKNFLYDLIAEIEMKEKIIIDIKAYHENDLKSVWTPFREKVLKEGIFYGAI